MQESVRCILGGLVVLLGAWMGPVAVAQAANHCPVVLVHGFAGFGRGELLGYKYWGGRTDLQETLKARYADQEIFTAVVGPFSSNYDRAVELFYQIKGGCVDYGAQHAARHGHLRQPQAVNPNGRTCHPGLYPQWDGEHPVHLLAHSQGGQTSRLLVQLLAANGAPENAGLFAQAVSADWVKSVTTLATPHDGTTLAYRVPDWVPFVRQLVAGLAGLAGFSGNPLLGLYDFKLDQWHIGPQREGERFRDYLDRVLDSPVWRDPNLQDLSVYDLSPAGAAAINAWVREQPGVYYFSVSTEASDPGWFTERHYPEFSANPLIGLFCGLGFMGDFRPEGQPFPAVDPVSWYRSDCVVNTTAQAAPLWERSPQGPLRDRRTQLIRFDASQVPQPGVWNWKGLMEHFDHFDIIGWTYSWDSTAWYQQHLDLLRRL